MIDHYGTANIRELADFEYISIYIQVYKLKLG